MKLDSAISFNASSAFIKALEQIFQKLTFILNNRVNIDEDIFEYRPISFNHFMNHVIYTRYASALPLLCSVSFESNELSFPPSAPSMNIETASVHSSSTLLSPGIHVPNNFYSPAITPLSNPTSENTFNFKSTKVNNGIMPVKSATEIVEESARADRLRAAANALAASKIVPTPSNFKSTSNLKQVPELNKAKSLMKREPTSKSMSSVNPPHLPSSDSKSSSSNIHLKRKHDDKNQRQKLVDKKCKVDPIISRNNKVLTSNIIPTDNKVSSSFVPAPKAAIRSSNPNINRPIGKIVPTVTGPNNDTPFYSSLLLQDEFVPTSINYQTILVNFKPISPHLAKLNPSSFNDSTFKSPIVPLGAMKEKHVFISASPLNDARPTNVILPTNNFKVPSSTVKRKIFESPALDRSHNNNGSIINVSRRLSLSPD